ncbi:MAG: GNAT family N-acetyltransferase [Anaerolineae bacterium]|nr:GNAT family N-acetyltransferase [Anaerolineae bacterium]
MQIRPYQGADEAGLLDVWHAAMTHDRISAEIFRTQVLLDPNFHPERLPVAVADGRVVGFVLALARQVPLFLQGLEPERAWITAFGVHPDYQRRGIGRALFGHALDRLAGEGRKEVAISPYVPNYFVPGVDVNAYPGTLPFLKGAVGFEELYRAISMGADLTGFQIPPDILALERRREQEDGVTIRPVTSADLPDLMPFLVEHFGWDWFRHAQEYLLQYFGGGGGSPICFLVARQRGAVVGFCQQRGERFGPFGVRPDCRNLGIGRLLLFRCLSIMSARHVFYAYFLWTGEDAARLYALAGFKRRREFAILRKTL